MDHDHKTGRIRGLLCIGCNVGLACFEKGAWTVRDTWYLTRSFDIRYPHGAPEKSSKGEVLKRAEVSSNEPQ